MAGLVTIAIPVYTRLEFLPEALKCVEAQEYPDIELLVSDNGLSGSRLAELVEQHYSRPYTLRHRPKILEFTDHWNQLVAEANGEYFVMLCDDDHISSNFVSELVPLLEANPDASVAIPRHQTMHENGALKGESVEPRPDRMPSDEFLLAWARREYTFYLMVTLLARTEAIRRCGGYPRYQRGVHCEDALLVKLCLESGSVMLGQTCYFRWRIADSSFGFSTKPHELASAVRQYIDFFESDPVVLRFAAEHPERWATLKAELVKKGPRNYLWYWQTLYRERLSTLDWLRAAFHMPPIPFYYRHVAGFGRHLLQRRLRETVRRRASQVRASAQGHGLSSRR